MSKQQRRRALGQAVKSVINSLWGTPTVRQQLSPAVLERLEARQLLTAIAWTGKGDGLTWGDAGNWDVRVPLSGDDVTINVAGNPTIHISSGNYAVHNLFYSDSIVLDGGSLTVGSNGITSTVSSSGGAISVTSNTSALTLAGDWSSNGTINVSNNGLVVLGGSFTTADIGTINSSGGTVLLSGTLDNRNTTLNLNNSTGSWTLGTSGKIEGGTISTSGSAVLLAEGQLDSSLQMITVAGTLQVPDYNCLTIVGGVSFSNAEVTLGQSQYGHLIFQGSQNVTGTASITSVASSCVYLTQVGTEQPTVTFASGITMYGGYISSSTGTFVNYGTLVNDTNTRDLGFNASLVNECVRRTTGRRECGDRADPSRRGNDIPRFR